MIGTREAAGYPLHLLYEGVSEIEYSFGTDQPRMDPAERHLLTRVVGHGANGTFWAAAPGRFVFERWDPNTRELRSTLTPSIPSWLDGLGDPRGAGDRIERPKPTIHRIWEDGDAVLWVLASIPDPQWAPMHGELKPWLDPGDYAEVYDWVLHAIDPASGILVAWIQFDRRVNIQPPHSVLVHGGEYHADTLVFHLTVPRLAR